MSRAAHAHGSSKAALPSLGLIVLGWLLAWFGRGSFVAWLLRHTGETMVVGPSSPHALDRRLLELGFAFGFALALPMLWWQACALLAPATFERVRHRFTTYVCASYALLLALPAIAIVDVQLTPLGLVDLGRFQRDLYSLSTERDDPVPRFVAAFHVDEHVLVFGLAFLALALLASLVTPIFVLSRFHPAGWHERCVTILSASVTGCVLFVFLLFLVEKTFAATLPESFVNVGTALAAPPVVLWLRRRTAERETRLTRAALALGATLLLLAQNWFLIRTVLLGLVFVAAYWITAVFGLRLRRAAGKATQRTG